MEKTEILSLITEMKYIEAIEVLKEVINNDEEKIKTLDKIKKQILNAQYDYEKSQNSEKAEQDYLRKIYKNVMDLLEIYKDIFLEIPSEYIEKINKTIHLNLIKKQFDIVDKLSISTQNVRAKETSIFKTYSEPEEEQIDNIVNKINQLERLLKEYEDKLKNETEQSKKEKIIAIIEGLKYQINSDLEELKKIAELGHKKAER